MRADLKQRSRLRRVDEIFRRFLAATRAKLRLGDDELLRRAEEGVQSETREPAGRRKDDVS